MAMAATLPSFTTPRQDWRNRNWNRRCSGGIGMAFASLSSEPSLGVKITEGVGKLPKLLLHSAHGSEAEVYLFGGCITSWKVSSGKDLLFVRPDAVFDGKKPISGGIPHCFPQFGPGSMQQGLCFEALWFILFLKRRVSPFSAHDPRTVPSSPRSKHPSADTKSLHLAQLSLSTYPRTIFPPATDLLTTGEFSGDLSGVGHRSLLLHSHCDKHGFARNMSWSLVDSKSVEGNPVITLELKDDPYSRSMWNFGFQALYKVILNSKSLSTVLTITNTDNKPFSFTSALHTYFHASITGVSVKGLKGCKTLNKDPDPKNPLEGIENRDAIRFPGFVDCIYLNAPSDLQLHNGLGDKISVKNTNWSDAVLWNPHTNIESCYRDFVCVENAKIGQVHLEPNQSWTAEQHLSVI